MSHIVSIQTKIQDPIAVAAAWSQMNLAAPVQGTAKLFSSEVTGLIVKLPDWQYPVVIDTGTGQVKYDNYNGEWGNEAFLHQLMKNYAVEKCRLEARKKGFVVNEQQLQDGNVRLSIIEGG